MPARLKPRIADETLTKHEFPKDLTLRRRQEMGGWRLQGLEGREGWTE